MIKVYFLKQKGAAKKYTFDETLQRKTYVAKTGTGTPCKRRDIYSNQCKGDDRGPVQMGIEKKWMLEEKKIKDLKVR